MSEALDELRNTLEGKKDIGFTGESKDIIEYAADLLGSGKCIIFLNCNIS